MRSRIGNIFIEPTILAAVDRFQQCLLHSRGADWPMFFQYRMYTQSTRLTLAYTDNLHTSCKQFVHCHFQTAFPDRSHSQDDQTGCHSKARSMPYRVARRRYRHRHQYHPNESSSSESCSTSRQGG